MSKYIVLIALVGLVGCATPTQFRKNVVALRTTNQVYREIRQDARHRSLDDVKQKTREDILSSENPQ